MQQDVVWTELPDAALQQARAARARPELRLEHQAQRPGELAPAREQLVLRQQEQKASHQPGRLQALLDPQAPRPKARRVSGERLWRLLLWRLSPLGPSPRRRLLPRLACGNGPGLF